MTSRFTKKLIDERVKVDALSSRNESGESLLTLSHRGRLIVNTDKSLDSTALVDPLSGCIAASTKLAVA
jgi:hypothetical protein